jgi:alkaline phosphatase D
VYEIQRPNGYTIYEFETSKLTNNHAHGTRKEALFSYNKGNFFGMLTFDLTKPDPEVTFRCITSEKKTVYTLTLKRSQLQ